MSALRAIDLFAGAGGFTTGAVAAGINVVWAANHWPAAVACHSLNHPATEHACQDLHQMDWARVPAHDLLLASPACQGHTHARGKDRPHHDTARSTAWAVVSAAEACRPRSIIVENVVGFRRWTLFPSWIGALQRLGYHITADVLDAADLGIPQHRVRLFVRGQLGRTPPPIVLPPRTHRAARTILDTASPHWSRVRTLCARTRARVDAGRRAHGREFLVAYYGTEAGGRSLDLPLGTVTTRDRFAVVDGPWLRMLTVAEYRRAMGFPDTYHLPPQQRLAKHLLGNAVPPPLAMAVIRQSTANTNPSGGVTTT